MELLLNVAGIKALHVPFRGVAAAIARDGRRPRRHGDRQPLLRPVAGAGRHAARPRHHRRERSPLLPDVPTFAEAGEPRFNMPYWLALAAPAGTPAPIIERLNREIVRACAQPRLREAFKKQAALAVTSTPAEMTRHVAREIEIWRGVVARANITIQ